MKLTVSTAEREYDIILEAGAIKKIEKYINTARKALIVTDTGVPENYSSAVAEKFDSSVIVRLPQGEKSKNIENFQLLLEKMLDASFNRKDCVVAVGGGVVGDISGFAASCYMRGIDFYNIPTTLLSQVDSSIGGKTAVDFKGVKNIIGSFYQPSAVIVDFDTLKTLDKRQLHAGLAESIKMAATCDAQLFEFIEKSGDIMADLPEIIKRSLEIKRDVVQKDPKEKGLRRILNFGHTLGHAVESYMNGKLLHGECVALGMLPMCSEEVRERLKALLYKYELPSNFSADATELERFVKHDKKAEKDSIAIVFVDKVGSWQIKDASPDDILKMYGSVFN